MKVLLFANTEWYLYNFRLALARALRATGAEVVLISPAGPYGARLQDEGFRWIALPMDRRSLNPIREFLFLLYLAKLYRRERPDIVHHFTIKCVIYGSLAARLAGIRTRINAVAGMGYVFVSNELRARLLRPFVHVLMRVALSGKDSRLILQNSNDLAVFERAGLIDAKRLCLIPGSGVDTNRFRPLDMPIALHRRFRIFFSARLLWDKGVQELVDAAEHLKAAGFQMDFLLAGAPDPGNPGTVSESIVRVWNDAGVVRCLGHVDDVLYWLHQVDIAVLPSNYGEGVPRSLIEAAACGLPIITTDTPGCRDIVKHGLNGLLVPCRDPIALASAIRFMFENPNERSRMGLAGRARVIEEFSERIVLTKTMDIYKEVMPEGFGQEPN